MNLVLAAAAAMSLSDKGAAYATYVAALEAEAASALQVRLAPVGV